MDPRKKKNQEIICRCNNIQKSTIEKAIVDGADALDKIFDSTTAGVGACGGTCRGKLSKMLEMYQREGKFPETFIQRKKRRK